MNSGQMRSCTSHTDRRESRPKALEANGAPLSVRIRSGRPVLAKGPLEERLRRRDGRGGQAVAHEQEPRVGILEREGVAVGPGAQPELALEVRRPEAVGPGGWTDRSPGVCQRRGLRRRRGMSP